jgi:hypothetical protein
LAKGSFSQRKFATEQACDSLPLHEESPARFSVILSLGEDTRCPVSVFVQLSSNGRTGIFSMVISWKFAQGPGAQFAFFLLGHHFCLRLTLRTFFFLHGSLLEPGREPVDD